MLNRLKNAAIWLLSIGSALLFAMYKGQQASRAKADLRAVRASQEAENRANNALIKGMENENKAIGSTSDGRFLD